MNIELKPIAEKKVRQLGGDVCGVLVRTNGGVMAVSEHGRCTRLDAGVMGPVEPAGMSDMREAFEEWLVSEKFDGSRIARVIAWKAWQAARAQGGPGAEVAADFRAEIRTEHDPSDEYVSYLTLIADGKSHPYLHIPESLDQSVLGEALRRLNTQPQPAVPEGWKLVPVEPSSEMLFAPCFGAVGKRQIPSVNGAIWKAMIEAVPQLASGGDHG